MHIRFMQDDFYALITANSSMAFDPIRTFVDDALEERVKPIAYMLAEDNSRGIEIARTFTPLYDALYLTTKDHAIRSSDFELKLSPLHFVAEAHSNAIKFAASVLGGRKLPEMAKYDFFPSNIRENLFVETEHWIAIGWAKYETKDRFIIKAELYLWKSNDHSNMLTVDNRQLLAVPKEMARPLSNNEYFAKKLKYGF